ncbi:MAG: phage minor head protein [Moheibacter sp.]
MFDSAIRDNDIPEEMMRALQSDAFLFGSLKTHAQLLEADSLLTKDGRVKSYRELDDEFRKLNVEYNQNYLEAEYQFAVNSSQMAAKWEELDDSGRYLLQYRTAEDDRVRPEHEELAGTTLPKDDDFWLFYYPPNGWNCRCTVVEVRRGKYDESDSEEAIKKGERATTQIGKDGQNRAAMFRFNPGMEEKLIPQNHPYYPKGCGSDLSALKGLPVIVLNARKDGCRAKKEIEKLNKERVYTDYEKKLQSKYDKSWTIKDTFPEKDGYIIVQDGHGKAEMEQNVKSFLPLAKNGEKVELIKQETIMVDGVKRKTKTHDAILINRNQKWEGKLTKDYINLTNISSKAVQAQEQGAEYVLIDIYKNKNFNVNDLIKGVDYSFKGTNLKGICVMIESDKYRIISRNQFENKQYEKILKKWLTTY